MTTIIVGALVLIVTAVLADRASDTWRPWCWALFVLLVIVFAYAQIQEKRDSDKEHEAQERSIREQGGNIRTLNAQVLGLEGDLTKSELQRRIDNAILQTKLEDYSQLAQIAPALMQLAKNAEEYQKKQYETKALSDHELYQQAMNVASKLRTLSSKYEQLQQDASDAQQAAATAFRAAPMSSEERSKLFREYSDRITQLDSQKRSDFQTNIWPELIETRNALIARKVAEPPLDEFSKQRVQMVTQFGQLAGAYPEREVATYLEVWAKPLAGK